MAGNVRLVAEEAAELLEGLAPAPEPAPPKPPKAVERDEALLGVFAALAKLISARAILGLAVISAAGLGLLAAVQGTLPALAASGVFNLTVLVPLVALAWRKG